MKGLNITAFASIGLALAIGVLITNEWLALDVFLQVLGVIGPAVGAGGVAYAQGLKTPYPNGHGPVIGDG